MNDEELQDGEEAARLEALLREFRPRAPRPLPPVGARYPYAWRGLGVAAALVLAVVAAWRFRERATPSGNPQIASTAAPVPGPAPALTAGATMQRANGNLDRIDEVLSTASRQLLLPVERSDGALRGLAKE